MGVTVSIQGFSGTKSKEFQKHLKAVKFCVENELSYPIETSDYFRGKVGGSDDLEDYNPEEVISYIENGIEIYIPIEGDVEYGDGATIKMSDIPSTVELLKISMS